MTADDIEIRLAHRDERADLATLTNDVFRPPPPIERDMVTSLPRFFAPDNIPLWAVAVANGRIVSAVGAHTFTVRSDPFVFTAAHVGAVCTDPEWRGHGLASRLLALEYDLLRSLGIDVAFISGNRSLYPRSGAAILHEFKEIHLQAYPSPSHTLRPLDADSVAEAAALWAREPVTIERTHEMWTTGLAAPPDAPGMRRAAILVGDPASAYVVMDYDPARRSGEIHELAGLRAAALAGMRHQAAQLGLDTISLPLPYWDGELVQALTGIGIDVTDPSNDEDALPTSYRLIDPVQLFTRFTGLASRFHPELASYRLWPREGTYNLERSGTTVGSGDVAWVCRLLFGAEGRMLGPSFPVRLPAWYGVTYG